MSKKYPPIEYLNECFSYEEKTGYIFWKERPREHFKTVRGWRTFISQRSGSRAGSITSHGYYEVMKLYVHRVIYILNHGYNPESFLDHIDRDKTNNRIENLREASQSCNMRNSKIFSNNTSGITGVMWDKSRGKWVARIRVQYKQLHIGRYSDFNDAVCARLAAEQCLGWSGCDSNSPAYQYVKGER